MKTLKDLEEFWHEEASSEDLRELAIKWVNKLRYWIQNPDEWYKDIKKNSVNGSYYECSREEYLKMSKEIEKIDKDFRIKKMITDYTAQIQWIKYFFGLTEDDLK